MHSVTLYIVHSLWRIIFVIIGYYWGNFRQRDLEEIAWDSTNPNVLVVFLKSKLIHKHVNQYVGNMVGLIKNMIVFEPTTFSIHTILYNNTVGVTVQTLPIPWTCGDNAQASNMPAFEPQTKHK